MPDLKYYIHCFKTLRRDNKNGGAPHKPVLIISIIDLFEKGEISGNRIFITPELVGSFRSHWSELVTSNHHMIFALPFYHLRSEPFWHLVANPGCERWVESKSSMRSLANLTIAINYARLDDDLLQLLLNKENREILKFALLEKYFPFAKNYFEGSGSKLYDGLARELAEEAPEDYKRKILSLKEKLDQEAFEEEIFVRGGIFKREIPKIYNNACAISGFRIDSTLNVSMVDACHIIPFAESFDDTITNGIALCPNFHRALDRGLISFSDDYRVLVSKNFNEWNHSPYSIRQFAGKQIHLPENLKFAPSLENLKSHRQTHEF